MQRSFAESYGVGSPKFAELATAAKTAATEGEYIASASLAQYESELQEAVRRAQALPEHHRVRATPKVVSERLHALRSAAKPGRTQMRNSHIKAALGAHGGCEG